MANMIDISGKAQGETEELKEKVSFLEARVAELIKNNSDYEIFTNTIQSGVSKHILDDNLTCYYANDYFFFMIGCTREEFVGELKSSVAPLVDSDDDATFRKELHYCVENNINNFHMNLHITRRDGYNLCFKTSVSIFTEKQTGTVHFYCIHTDITTAIINQQIASRKMHFLENVCGSMMTALAIVDVKEDDLSMRVRYANTAAMNIFGIDESVYKSSSFNPTTLIEPDDLDYVRGIISDVVKTKKPAKFESRIKSDNAKHKWICSSVKPASQSRNGITSLLIEFENITERHRLRVENEYILENMPGFMAKFIIKEKGPLLVDANSRFYEFFNTTKEDYINNNAFYIRHYNNEIMDKVREHMDELHKGMPVSFEYRTRKPPNDEITWLRLQASCMGFEDGYPIYLAVQYDVSDMKNLESKITEEKERYRIAYRNSKTTMFEYNILTDTLYHFHRDDGDSDTVSCVENYISSGTLANDTHPSDRMLLQKFFKGQAERTIKIRRNTARFGYDGYEWVELTATPMLGDDEKPLKIIGNFRPIGEQDNSIYEKIEKVVKDNPETPFAVIRMDIDNFKMINDLYGWKEGNKVLSFIASSLRDVVPDDRYPVGRITADIFCVCLPFESEQQIASVINSVISVIREYPIDFNITAHFGVYITSDDTVNIPATIMFDRANLALKTVKNKISSAFAFFDSNLRDAIIEEKLIEKEMYSALESGQFVTYYQPKYNISTGTVVGAEALVRWKHPEKGIVPPNSFIPLFEKNGFIINVDEYIWEDVCRRMSEWKKSGLTLIPVSVNVSRLHVFDSGFCTKIKSLVEKYNVPANMIILEFTESLFLENAEGMIRIMNELRDAGFLISMDDFGSGFSSLNMLKDMPLNEVKIDKEFLNETTMSGASKSKTVVAGTILMVNQLDMKIIAEGVETPEQAEFLLAAGCNTAQGFYYSKPIPVDDFEKLVFGKKF